MRKYMKRLMVLAAVLVMAVSAVPVSAENITYGKAYVYLQKQVKNKADRIDIGMYHPKKDTFTYNKSMATVKAYASSSWGGYKYYAFYPKKAGKTTLTIKCKSEATFIKGTLKYPFVILNYTNPVAAVRLGGSLVPGSKFNNTDRITVNYNKFSKKTNTFKFVPKKGWTVWSVEAVNKAGKTVDDVYIRFSKNKKSFKAKGGKGNYTLRIRLQNNKTMAYEYVEIAFK